MMGIGKPRIHPNSAYLILPARLDLILLFILQPLLFLNAMEEWMPVDPFPDDTGVGDCRVEPKAEPGTC